MIENAPAQVATLRPSLRDSFARAVTYLRLSLTDRCDLRCVYRLASAFIELGVRKLRLPGGEPLVRREFMSLV